MSYLMKLNSCLYSPSIITMGLNIHMPGECMEREQGRFGILKRTI